MPEPELHIHIIEKKDLTASDKVQATLDEIYGKGMTLVEVDSTKFVVKTIKKNPENLLGKLKEKGC
ncbi:hypothetical protein ACHAPT_008795 [Fusarium lateritium]